MPHTSTKSGELSLALQLKDRKFWLRMLAYQGMRFVQTILSKLHKYLHSQRENRSLHLMQRLSYLPDAAYYYSFAALQ